MAATLDDLLKIEGVTFAFEYTPDGKCLDYRARTNGSPEMAAMIARFCALVTMTFNTLAAAFTGLSEQNWVPQQGWMYAGGDYTVVIGGGGYRGLFGETAKAHVNELLMALSG